MPVHNGKNEKDWMIRSQVPNRSYSSTVISYGKGSETKWRWGV